jgi:hypothetical protein
MVFQVLDVAKQAGPNDLSPAIAIRAEKQDAAKPEAAA